MAYEGAFDPKRIVFTIGDPVTALGVAVVIPGFASLAIASGRGPDSQVAAARATDTFTITVGADGDATHNRSQNKSGTITLVLTDGSGFNTAIGLLQTAQESEIIPHFTVPVTVTDQNATPPSIIFGSNCVLQRPADYEGGATDGTNTWVFLPASMSITHVGRTF